MFVLNTGAFQETRWPDWLVAPNSWPGMYKHLLAASMLALLIVIARTARRPQHQPITMPRTVPLGIGVPAVRNARRYHSITVLSESAPLLMETGHEFFAPPTVRRKRSPRRNFTEPSSLMQTLQASASAQGGPRPAHTATHTRMQTCVNAIHDVDASHPS
ncbi:hypothetical protein IWW50_004810 [Coemansia erecta]|nr:hypothetical protein IWW50_004810 [Coemansia erecta]